MPLAAKSLIGALLSRNPSTRLGAGPSGWRDVMSHPFFARVDWGCVGKGRVHSLIDAVCAILLLFHPRLLEAKVLPASSMPGERLDSGTGCTSRMITSHRCFFVAYSMAVNSASAPDKMANQHVGAQVRGAQLRGCGTPVPVH